MIGKRRERREAGPEPRTMIEAVLRSVYKSVGLGSTPHCEIFIGPPYGEMLFETSYLYPYDLNFF